MKECWEIHWKDYYKILQIDPSAEPEVVKAAYDRLARKYHPDVNKDFKSAERMKDLNEAFEILNHPEKRNRYHTAYLQKNRGGHDNTVNTHAHYPTPKTQETPTKTPNVVRTGNWCAKCKEFTNMRILHVDKKPAFATCPKCGTHWDIKDIKPKEHLNFNHIPYNLNNDELTPDNLRRLKELQNMINKRSR